MKNDRDIIRLRHMLDAILEALQFAEGKSSHDLANNKMLALALIKEIELIGEAANKVSEDYKNNHREIPWKTLIATRNRLIHGYFDIDYEIVWTTVERDLPALKEVLVRIL